MAFIIKCRNVFQYGILCGIGVSILMLLYPWARPEIEVTVFQELSCFNLKIVQTGQIIV